MSLRLRDLRKSFGTTVAVDALSLEIRPGEVFGLLGPNGAGKSTTINMAMGLLEPDSGEITIEAGGAPGSPQDPRFRSALGLAPQQIALYDEMSAEENLAFFGRIHGLSGEPLRARLGTLLDLAGLQDRRRSRVKTFSGGMKRRLNLVAALLHDPPFLLLDEPTAGVDPQSRSALLDLVRGLRDQGRTIVYTTHYMEEAERVCDRVGIIDHGRMLAVGTVDELIAAHGGSSTITVQEDPADGSGVPVERSHQTDDPAGELVRLLKGQAIRGVRIDRPSLETVFLALTGRRLRD